MEDNRILFWPIPRDIVVPESNVSDAKKLAILSKQLRSLITYQLIFGGPLLIRETDYINSQILRRAYQHAIQTPLAKLTPDEQFINQLIDNKLLLLTKRNDTSFIDIRNVIPPPQNGGSWFFRNEDLEQFDDYTNDFSYNLDDARTYYSDNIFQLLSTNLSNYIPNEIRDRLLEATTTIYQQHGTLSWSVFSYDGMIWQFFSEAEKHQYKNFVYKQLGQAPHVGFLPQTFGINTIYMDDVADAITMWRGRHAMQSTLLEKKTISLHPKGFSFTQYREAFTWLDYDTVYEIMQSDIYNNFHTTRRNPASHQDEMLLLYKEYRKYLDSILYRIAPTLPYDAGPETFQLHALFQNNELKDTLCYFLDALIALPLMATANLVYTGMAKIATGASPSQQKERSIKQKRSQSLHNTIEELQEHGELITNETDHYTLYSEQKVTVTDQENHKQDIGI